MSSHLLPLPVVSAQVVPVSAARLDKPAVYVYNCCALLPACGGVRCSAGQESWRQCHQTRGFHPSMTAPAENIKKMTQNNIIVICLFEFRINGPVNNISVMSSNL